MRPVCNQSNVLPYLWKYEIVVDNESITFPYSFEDNLLIESKFKENISSNHGEDIVFYLRNKNNQTKSRKFIFQNKNRIMYQESTKECTNYKLQRISIFESTVIRIDTVHKIGFIQTVEPQKLKELCFKFTHVKFDTHRLRN